MENYNLKKNNITFMLLYLTRPSSCDYKVQDMHHEILNFLKNRNYFEFPDFLIEYIF